MISAIKGFVLGVVIGFTIINYININNLTAEVHALKTEKISGWGND